VARRNASLRRIGTRAVLILSVILLGFGAITFALWVGGHDVVARRMTGGERAAFVFRAGGLHARLAALQFADA
jgi:ATP-binding cassette subfamily B protein